MLIMRVPASSVKALTNWEGARSVSREALTSGRTVAAEGRRRLGSPPVSRHLAASSMWLPTPIVLIVQLQRPRGQISPLAWVGWGTFRNRSRGTKWMIEEPHVKWVRAQAKIASRLSCTRWPRTWPLMDRSGANGRSIRAFGVMSVLETSRTSQPRDMAGRVLSRRRSAETVGKH